MISVIDKITILNKRISIIDAEMEATIPILDAIDGESEEYNRLKIHISNMLSYRKALSNKYDELLDTSRQF
jgi:hypothetical protein